MSSKEKFLELMERRNSIAGMGQKSQLEREMTNILKEYYRENFKYLENDEDVIIQIKSDFESDLPVDILSEATGIDIKTCRRFRYIPGRGVVDKRPNSGRDSIPPSVRESVRERDDGQCVKCGDEEELSIHHIIPLSHGGINTESNYALLCKVCHKEAHNGNFGTRRMAYETKKEFWEDFCNV